MEEHSHGPKHVTKKSYWVHCLTCSKVYTCRREANAHLKRVHLNVKNYACKKCGYPFFDKKDSCRHEMKCGSLNYQTICARYPPKEGVKTDPQIQAALASQIPIPPVQKQIHDNQTHANSNQIILDHSYGTVAYTETTDMAFASSYIQVSTIAYRCVLTIFCLVKFSCKF